MPDHDDVTRRLITCFAEVFPDLSEDEIMVADHEQLDEWDSLAAISLVALVEEEFDIQLDELNVDALTTFDAVRSAVNESLSAG